MLVVRNKGCAGRHVHTSKPKDAWQQHLGQVSRASLMLLDERFGCTLATCFIALLLSKKNPLKPIKLLAIIDLRYSRNPHKTLLYPHPEKRAVHALTFRILHSFYENWLEDDCKLLVNQVLTKDTNVQKHFFRRIPPTIGLLFTSIEIRLNKFYAACLGGFYANYQKLYFHRSISHWL